jgi:hypothetical protein
MITQLAREDFAIVGASECAQNRDMRTGKSFHTDTRRKAMFVRLKSLSTEEPDHAILEWESYHHVLYAEGSTLRLEHSDGVWQVVEVFESWNS